MAQSASLKCPSCGRPVELSSSFVKAVVCSHCSSALALRNISPEAPAARPKAYPTDILSDRNILLDIAGKSAALASYPTQLGIGLSGRFRGKRFLILGRVRFEYDDGYWDEWYLEFEGGDIAWLEEEEGEYTLSQKEPLTSQVPGFDEVRVGDTLMINGQPFFVTERTRAQVAGAEGQLFYRPDLNHPVRFIDGNIGGRVAFIEYGDDEIEYSVGEPIERHELVVSRES